MILIENHNSLVASIHNCLDFTFFFTERTGNNKEFLAHTSYEFYKLKKTKFLSIFTRDMRSSLLYLR